MWRCHLCESSDLVEFLDFGLQPICNRFLTNAQSSESLYPMALGHCPACGLIQITRPVPAEELRSPYDWITYSEPEAHLDRLAKTIAGLPGITKDSEIWGVSFKDDSLLERIRKLGIERTYRFDGRTDLGLSLRDAGVEMVQNRLTSESARSVVARRGRPRAIIARHMFEHAHNLPGFMNTLSELVGAGGYVILEVPDCQKALEHFDCTTVWEEHIAYFTEDTFVRSFPRAGLSLVHYERSPYALEDSLIGIATPVAATGGSVAPPTAVEFKIVGNFRTGLESRRHRLLEYLSRFRRDSGKIALFGAGHLACTFVNLLRLQEYFDFVVDDNPNKLGLFMPGSRLLIQDSSALVRERIKLCLLATNPEKEDAIVQRNSAFAVQNGQFASIFPTSKRGLVVSQADS